MISGMLVLDTQSAMVCAAGIEADAEGRVSLPRSRRVQRQESGRLEVTPGGDEEEVMQTASSRRQA